MPERELSGHKIEAAVSDAMKALAELDSDDEQLKSDTIEGQSNFYEVADMLAEEIARDTLLIDTAEERIKRKKAKVERRREILRNMLEAVNLRKLERPLFTASIAYHQKAIVTDENALPPEYIRHAPDKIAINKALRNGDAIPGAVLGNSSPVLTLRLK
jgi:tagatose-1,6-bisphosphate aldolase